jgi:hypothetical protein
MPLVLASFYFPPGQAKGTTYGMFKLVRYLRLFEMDGQIQDILDFYSNTRTVFEIKQMKRSLDIIQFGFSTMINLHMLTCSMILLCVARGDFQNSWMGNNGVEEGNAVEQYIIAIYFVTTTLSTCGFGDLYASQGDATEALFILLLQFIGMLFYSLTI